VLHLVTKDNRALYKPEMDDLHRARKSVFVDELGWRLRVRDGMEFDEYDDERAMHIIGFGADRGVVMGIRIRPADDRSMLGDHFTGFLKPGGRPFGDGRTWEVSRGFCRERGLRRPHFMRKAACMISPLEIALAAGIDRYIGFTDIRMLSLYSQFGWKLNMLGDPMPYGEGDGVAYEAEVSQDVVNTIRQTWGLPDPAYIRLNDLGGAADVHEVEATISAEDPKRSQLLPPPPGPEPVKRRFSRAPS
jgi:N-acyl-L-homoserine lactone synthetase